MNTWSADVLVIGGGTAGTTAAIGAAEEGARVTLVERDSALGGVGVRAGVHLYYYGSLGGVQGEIDNTTRSLAKEMGGKANGFHPEGKNLAITARLEELGVRIVYDAVVAEMIMDGKRVLGAVVESNDNRCEITAAVTIDASGDGDAAFLAGAAYTLGREWDGTLHTFSMVPRYLDASHVQRYKNFDVGWVDSTDVRDVSRAYRIGRSTAWRNDEDPTNTHYTVVGPQLGVREGRFITGEYVLRQDDLLLDRRFDDVVMRCFSHHDTHAFDYANESDFTQIYIPVLGMRKFGFGGDVPYRCFVPAEIDGLLIGCRALSQDRDCAMTLRMQRDMHKVGEVAGVAAACSVKEGVLPRQIDVGNLQRRLVARGVLKQEDLHRESLPWMAFEGETREELKQWLKESESPRFIERLIGYLGTKEEETALWWIWQLGSVATAPLMAALADAEGARRRGIAFALGLLKHPDSIPLLAEVFRRGDTDKKSDPLTCSEERWLAALILLKQQRAAVVVPEALTRLHTERRSTAVLYLLHYLIAVADQFSDEQRGQAEEAIAVLLSDQELGSDYFVKGSHGIAPTKGDSSSMKWGIELTAASLLEWLGADGDSIVLRYMQDSRGYARAAARRMLEHLAGKKGAIRE
jgi:hypothetical protein